MRRKNISKRLTSIALIAALAFVFSFTVIADDSYAASKGKKYYLPVNVFIDETGVAQEDVTFDEMGIDDIKYDKYGNIKSAMYGGIPYKAKIKYRKKGVIKSVTATYDGKKITKTYDKKGRLKTVKTPKSTYKYKLGKKGTVKKVTKKGKTYYKVKSIKFHKNGFVKKVVYSNGNTDTYNNKGLVTKSYNKKEKATYTFKYKYSDGKVIKAEEYRNKKLITTYYYDYTNYGESKPKTTKSVWKYSCAMAFLSGPTAAGELHPKASVSGINNVDY